MKIKVAKIASNAKALQEVRYQNNKRNVLQHIVSAHSTEALNELMILAEEWMTDFNLNRPHKSPNYKTPLYMLA